MNIYLQEHLAKYPLMELQDILKLYLQGYLGPAHLVLDKESCLNRINHEYFSIKDMDLHHQEIEEELSTDYVRIYLYPYYNKEKDFSLLVDAFIASSKIRGDIVEFKSSVKELITENNTDDIYAYLNSGDYLISHSDNYKKHYHPHYLVIHKKYLSSIYKHSK